MDPTPNALLNAAAGQAWEHLRQRVWALFSSPLPDDQPFKALLERELALNDLELLLSSAAWELWRDFEAQVPRASDGVAEFWAGTSPGRAVLILDALSLREAAWLLQEAPGRGFTVLQAEARGSELPSDTRFFARALGFAGGRSSLENNGATGSSHRLPGARTESLGAAWAACADGFHAAPDVVLWHHWPDDRIHALSGPGDGFRTLAGEAVAQLRSDGFWSLVKKLATGRTLLITSDHGYAAAGMFPDVSAGDQGKWLKETFSGGRYAAGAGDPDPFLPPLALDLYNVHGTHRFALGRRRWKSQGGYPTLAHGGLSLLETFVPFIKLAPR